MFSHPAKRNHFKYDKIQTSRHQIRLVVLAGSTRFDSTIICDLCTVSLAKDVRYEALSYVWGNPKEAPKQIFLRSQPFWVTPNLESALRHLRFPDRHRILWIDSICINQNDAKERGEQVGMMGRIYKSASWDILWIGPDLDMYRHALPILEYKFSAHRQKAHEELALFVGNCKSPAWNDLVSFFQSTVWQRMWIVQELVLAKNMFVVCGLKYLPYECLKCVATLLFSPRYICRLPVLAYRGSTQVANITSLRNWKEQDGPNDLLRIWYDFGWSKCQDPRDKIYAILNIITDHLNIRPDYDISPNALFPRVTRHYILQRQDLNILGYAWTGSPSSADFHVLQKRQLANTKISPYTLPSWCADFGSDDQPYCARFFFERSQDPKFRVGIPWDSRCTKLLQARTDTDLNRLSLLGVTLDQMHLVTQSTRSWPDKQTLTHYYNELPSKLGSPGKLYFNSDTMKEAYWVTICGGMARPNDDNWKVIPLHGSTATAQLDSKTKPSGLKKLFGSSKKRNPEGNNKVMEQDLAAAQAAEEHLKEHVIESTRYSAFCVTKKGYMALVPDTAQVGDVLVSLYGGCAPFVLRLNAAMGKEQLWKLIGPAYVHGFMDGTPLQWRDEGVLKEREFVLV
jgi:hypothetical protein